MDKMHDRHRNNQEGIAYTLLKFSLPLIFSGILQQLYNWADAFIVGNVEGELALAAIGATGTVVNFILWRLQDSRWGFPSFLPISRAAGKTRPYRKSCPPSPCCLVWAFSRLQPWESGWHTQSCVCYIPQGIPYAWQGIISGLYLQAFHFWQCTMFTPPRCGESGTAGRRSWPSFFLLR